MDHLNQRIPEETALNLWRGLGSLDDTGKADAIEILDRYKRQQEDNGDPLWPSQQRFLQESQGRIRDMFSGLDKVPSEVSPFSSDPDRDRAVHANTAFLSWRYQKPADEIVKRRDFYLRDYASQKWGKFDLDERGFYAGAAKEIAAQDADENTMLEGRKAALRGEDSVLALAAYQAKSGGDWREMLRTSKLYSQGLAQGQDIIGENLPLAGELMGLIERRAAKSKGGAEVNAGAPYDDAAARRLDEIMAAMGEMKPGERKRIYASITARAEAAGYDPKGFWSQMLSELDRGLERTGSTLGTQAGIAADVMSNFPAMLAEGATGNQDFGMTEAERIATDVSIKRRQNIGTIHNELAGIVAGTIDPIRTYFAPDSFMGTMESGAIKAPGAVLPFMAASAAMGPWGAGALFAADFAEQNRRDLEAAGIDRQKAIEIGAIAAPAQAAVESLSNLFQLGKFPAVTAALSRWTKPIGGTGSVAARYVQNSLLSGATEFSEEQIQDNLIRPAVQDLVAAFDKDVPQIGLGEIWRNVKASTPELLSVIAPMSLVFGGVMTAADAQLSEQMTSNIDALQSLGFSQAQATTISQQESLDGKVSKARELWGARAGDKTTMGEASKRLSDRLRMFQTDAIAAQQELERRGILPRVLHTADDSWRLTFNDGSVADYGTHAEASAARWQWTEDQLGKFHQLTRDTLNSLESNLGQNRELAVEFSPDARTASQAVGDNEALREQLTRRVQQGEALGDINLDDAYTNAIAIDKAQAGSEEDPLAAMQILGSSRNEFKDGILRTTIKLWEGANVLTLVEEKLEGDAKAIMMRKGGRDWLLSRLRTYEAESGDKLFRDAEQMEDTDIIEAWSHLGASYLVGRSTHGEPLQSKTMRRFGRLLMRAGLAGALNAESTFFAAVASRAQKIMEAKQSGKLPQDLADELEKQLGIDSQVSHENEAAKEADAIANEAAYAGGPSWSEENPGPNGETFSLRAPFTPPAFITRKFNERLDQWEKTGDAGRELINLGFTPPVLQLAGADNLSLVVSPSLFSKVTTEKHAVPIEALRALPQSLADPVAVFQSRTQANSLVVLTEFQEPGKGPLIAAVTLDKSAGKNWQVNEVASLYGRPAGDVVAMFGETPLYVNEKKSLAWSRQVGLQLPKRPTPQRGQGSIPGPDDVVKWADEKLKAQGRETHSLRSGDFESRMAAAFSPFQKSPELRVAVAKVAKQRALKLGAEWIEKAGVIRRVADIEREAQTREALKADELIRQGVEEKAARKAAKQQAKDWQEKALKDAKSPASQRAMLKAALRTLDGILAAAPPEVRARVGGYVRLAGLATDEAMFKEIEKRVEKLNVELEKWLRKEGIAQIEKLLKKGRPSTESGKKAKGKDADMHHLFAAAAKAAEMDETAVAGELARLDALIAGDTLTPEQEILATTERGLVELVGDLYPRTRDSGKKDKNGNPIFERIYDGAESARIFAAVDALQEIYDGAWLKWKLAQIERRERRAGARHDLITDTGKAGIKTERDAADAHAKTLFGSTMAKLLSLSSFHQELAYAFGENSPRVLALVDAEREASAQYEDASQALADQIDQLFTKMAGSALAGERLRFALAQRTIKTGKGELSQLEAIQALLMWAQEDGQRHMEGTRNENGEITSSWAYDQDWIDEIEKALTPEARRVMAWIKAEYAGEYGPLNALYRQRFGVNLPGHDNYAPITAAPMQLKAGEVNDPITGAAIASGSVLTPGSLRTRSRSAVAEPVFKDALQVLIAHRKQLEYWKAYYDVATEMSAILGHREVMNAVHAKAGAAAVEALRKRIDATAQGGFRDAATTLGVNDWLRRISGNAATVALVGRVSTLMVQSTQLAAASVKMPMGAYVVRFGKLLAGQLGWGDAIRSDFIQRRYKAAPPIVRQAMESLASQTKPNLIKHWAAQLGKLISGADALFTAGTYAILLDYHRGTGRALGLSGADLEAHANREAERATEEVAQPTRMNTRSLAEITNTNPLGKTAWAFSSESRQKIALFAWSLANIQKDKAQAVKTFALVFIVGGLMTQVLKAAWKTAKGEDDEETWNPARLFKAMAIQPLQGIPGVSEAMGEAGLLSSLRWLPSAAEDILSGDGDLKDAETLLSGLGYFNDTAAGIAALSHLGFDFAKILANLASDD